MDENETLEATNDTNNTTIDCSTSDTCIHPDQLLSLIESIAHILWNKHQSSQMNNSMSFVSVNKVIQTNTNDSNFDEIR
jgi:hypothetical protein